jgi:hypothetical protein
MDWRHFPLVRSEGGGVGERAPLLQRSSSTVNRAFESSTNLPKPVNLTRKYEALFLSAAVNGQQRFLAGLN